MRPADVVFSGGPVLTMHADQPRAEAVAVRDGRIVAVGSAGDVAGLIGSGTEVCDLDGRALLPGLIDPHMHSALVQLIPDKPVLVLESNGHITYVNSEALARAWVDRETPGRPAGRGFRDTPSRRDPVLELLRS